MMQGINDLNLEHETELKQMMNQKEGMIIVTSDKVKLI